MTHLIALFARFINTPLWYNKHLESMMSNVNIYNFVLYYLKSNMLTDTQCHCEIQTLAFYIKAASPLHCKFYIAIYHFDNRK
jgi:hypothetical protein